MVPSGHARGWVSRSVGRRGQGGRPGDRPRSYNTRGVALHACYAALYNRCYPRRTDMIYGYVRVSSIEQVQMDRTSLADQERQIRGCAMLRGSPEPKIYRDEGVSGSIPLSERPAGGQMVAALARGDVIIASKLDRLFRRASDALTTAERFKDQGVDLILLDAGVDPVTGTGAAKLFFSMLAAFAEFEKERMLERMSDGRKGKAKRGGHIGGDAPYGYRIVGAGQSAMLEPIVSEQETVAMTKSLRAVGLSMAAICGELAQAGRMARNGKPFVAAQVQRILLSRPV